MVASSQPLASAAGLRILDQGGNAADAAVATAAALAVTEPCNTGLGGDCFALYYCADTGRVTAMNSSGRAPAALDLARIKADGFAAGLPILHPHTVTVPGAAAGWCECLERHGTLPLADVLAPAIRLAAEGFPVGPNTAFIWKIGATNQLLKSPGGEQLLVDGRAPIAGQMFLNPGLAHTLEQLADRGREVFYQGEIGESIVAALREAGGVMSESDLAGHRVTWDEPISTVFEGLRVFECPPNGQGLAALMALSILREFDLGDDPYAADRIHFMIEAMRLAFADAHRFIADPAFARLPVAELLSEDYARGRSKSIDPRRANRQASHGAPLGGSDTVYFCAVDQAGNACSFINSNYMSFGTGIVPDGLGFSLQNRGIGFSLDPTHPNALEPGKRPFHTIIPGMITRVADGSLFAPFGVMGGFMQPQGHMQVVVAMARDGVDPQEALDRSRFNLSTGSANSAVVLESGFPEATVRELERRGHDPSVVSGAARIQFGRGQIIRRDPGGVLWGGSDPRADGCAVAQL